MLDPSSKPDALSPGPIGSASWVGDRDRPDQSNHVVTGECLDPVGVRSHEPGPAGAGKVPRTADTRQRPVGVAGVQIADKRVGAAQSVGPETLPQRSSDAEVGVRSQFTLLAAYQRVE